ncbi:MAG: MotA/TolQ/ExbB proton channel family protein [Puniceicoccales bacterium]|jgi:biopolymer transport protein ExbB|nr:MotA/TolQ/ExbB proton channel family protein [Puniceicoccales bacterium]
MLVVANVAADFFNRGGVIMWPLLICLVMSFVVIVERALWWATISRYEKSPLITRVFEAVCAGDFDEAEKLTSNPRNPFLRTLHKGLTQAHLSFLGSMQLEASGEVEKADRRLWILATLITLSPLLGLLGTVTGIMESFHAIGGEELAIVKVKGGIAEALIATASGLAIAILCLLPYNYFNRRLAHYRASLERAINHVEFIVESARYHGHDLELFARQRALANPVPKA